ncbi:hypothetical protein ARMGADRAFT_1032362 [Armillaria gallica]|uniref:Uncharacterized protein n=1 Tax=Armillaria gallica TaxID=47427 RepID=A0A2H3D9S8_ARMGA|nr:hypothetical protein ARMGADRAFT_1032362 [Armillaria gallica]
MNIKFPPIFGLQTPGPTLPLHMGGFLLYNPFSRKAPTMTYITPAQIQIGTATGIWLHLYSHKHSVNGHNPVLFSKVRILAMLVHSPEMRISERRSDIGRWLLGLAEPRTLNGYSHAHLVAMGLWFIKCLLRNRRQDPSPEPWHPAVYVNDTAVLYCLSGIVYYGNGHFTTRFIDLDGSVWLNDGIVQAGGARREGTTINVNLMQDVSSKTWDHFIYRRV